MSPARSDARLDDAVARRDGESVAAAPGFCDGLRRESPPRGSRPTHSTGMRLTLMFAPRDAGALERSLRTARPLWRARRRNALCASESGSASGSDSDSVSDSAFGSDAHPRPSARTRRTARGGYPTPHVSRCPHGPRDRRPASLPGPPLCTTSPREPGWMFCSGSTIPPGAKHRARHASAECAPPETPRRSADSRSLTVWGGGGARSWLSPGRTNAGHSSPTRCRRRRPAVGAGGGRRPPWRNRRRCASGAFDRDRFDRFLLPNLPEPSLLRERPGRRGS